RPQPLRHARGGELPRRREARLRRRDPPRIRSGALTPQRLAPGLWYWTARHPEWHPGEFGAEVGCYALEADGRLLLIDPLLPADGDGSVLDLLDELAADRATSVLITIGYHVR